MRGEHHPLHHAQQLLPDPPAKNTQPQTKETPVKHTSSSMQMGHIHIRGKRDNLHHQYFQKNRPKNRISHCKHHLQCTDTQYPDNRQVYPIRRIQTHMPQLQEDIRGTNWQKFHNTIPRAHKHLQKQQPLVQICQTSY